jgi:HSP20 family molecular chaperone IbpA
MNSTAQEVQQHEPKAVEPQAERPARQRPYAAPRVDVYETKDSFVVVADVPGVGDGALDVTVEKDQLTIEGRVEPVRRDNHRLRLVESSAGGFLRTFALPDGIDRERIAATVKNGVLRLTLPKSEAARPRRIVVQPSA